jgi:hypothetical protein
MNTNEKKLEAYIPSLERWLAAEKVPCRRGRGNNITYIYAVTDDANESFWGPEDTLLLREAR